MLKKNPNRRSSVNLQGMQSLWRVDLLASMNNEETEKIKKETLEKQAVKKERMQKL